MLLACLTLPTSGRAQSIELLPGLLVLGLPATVQLRVRDEHPAATMPPPGCAIAELWHGERPVPPDEITHHTGTVGPGGHWLLQVRSARPVDEPWLRLRITLTCHTPFQREFVLLPDSPSTSPAETVHPTAAAVDRPVAALPLKATPETATTAPASPPVPPAVQRRLRPTAQRPTSQAHFEPARRGAQEASAASRPGTGADTAVAPPIRTGRPDGSAAVMAAPTVAASAAWAGGSPLANAGQPRLSLDALLELDPPGAVLTTLRHAPALRPADALLHEALQSQWLRELQALHEEQRLTRNALATLGGRLEQSERDPSRHLMPLAALALAVAALLPRGTGTWSPGRLSATWGAGPGVLRRQRSGGPRPDESPSRHPHPTDLPQGRDHTAGTIHAVDTSAPTGVSADPARTDTPRPQQPRPAAARLDPDWLYPSASPADDPLTLVPDAHPAQSAGDDRTDGSASGGDTPWQAPVAGPGRLVPSTTHPLNGTTTSTDPADGAQTGPRASAEPTPWHAVAGLEERPDAPALREVGRLVRDGYAGAALAALELGAAPGRLRGPWTLLHLLDLYQQLGQPWNREPIRAELEARYNLHVRPSTDGADEGRPLEDHALCWPRICRLWHEPDRQHQLAALLLQPTRLEVLDLAAFRDALLLYALLAPETIDGVAAAVPAKPSTAPNLALTCTATDGPLVVMEDFDWSRVGLRD